MQLAYVFPLTCLSLHLVAFHTILYTPLTTHHHTTPHRTPIVVTFTFTPVSSSVLIILSNSTLSKMAAYFNTSTYPTTPPTPSSTTSSLQISAPLTADIIKAGYVSIKDSWLWGKKYLVLRPVTLSMYKNERIDGGTPQVVISLNDVINLKREEAKDYCFSMEIRGGKIWLFSFKSDGELYGWMDEVYSVLYP